MRRSIIGIIVLHVVMALDQISKLHMSKLYAAHGDITVFECCNLIQLWNKGISFGLFSTLENGNTVFMVLSAIMIAILSYTKIKTKSMSRSCCLSVIVGGALGNFVDRLRFGAVYDFIDLHIGDWHWPAFNLADLSITCGVIVFLVMELRKRSRLNA
ncbi:signal peptidase II [Anaplasma phagocytophilum]|uniref:signal peptidase II n=1 Tax=Anaplasma phagocytophilum TaxID=948 RepID=UPI00201AD726